MTPSNYFVITGFTMAIVFASLLFAVEIRGIINPQNRRRNPSVIGMAQREYIPSAVSFWSSEKFLALSAATLAVTIILFTK